MSVDFPCSNCGKVLRVGDDARGKSARCPDCGAVSTVPGSGLGASPFQPLPSATPPVVPPPPTFAPSPLSNPVDEVNPFQAPLVTDTSVYDPFGLQQNLASRGARFVGAIIDNLLFLMAFAPSIVIGVVTGEFNKAKDQQDETLSAIIGLVGIACMLGITILQWTLISTSGQSIGKKVMGTKIVKLDGRLPGFLNGVVLRIWIVRLISMCFCYFQFIAVMIDGLFIFGAERRCLHDLIASTRVVKK